MAVVQRLQDLFENLGRLFLREILGLDDRIKQLTTLANLSDKVNVLFILEVLIQL